MLEQRISGVAVMTAEMHAVWAGRLAVCAIAVVLLDVGQVRPCVSNIVVNYEKSIRGRAFAQLGHRRIAYISAPLRL